MPKHESLSGQDEVSDAKHVTEDKSEGAVDRFKSLTKKIISVSREEFNEQERIYNEQKKQRRKL